MYCDDCGDLLMDCTRDHAAERYATHCARCTYLLRECPCGIERQPVEDIDRCGSLAEGGCEVCEERAKWESMEFEMECAREQALLGD